MGDIDIAQYVAVALIGFLGTFCYAVASFGRAIVVHIVWSLLAFAFAQLDDQYIHIVVLITIQGVPFHLFVYFATLCL